MFRLLERLAGQPWYEVVALDLVSEEHVTGEAFPLMTGVQLDSQCQSLSLCFVLWRGTTVTPPRVFLGTNEKGHS